MNNVEQVQALYVGYYGRAADPDGLAYWSYQLAHGMSIGAIAASFSVQTESKVMYPFLNGSSNASQFVDQVYSNLFNRVPDAGGKAYWMNYLTAAQGNPDAISVFILAVIGGAQGTDVAVVQNKVDAAEHFTNAVQAAEIETTVPVNGIPALDSDFLSAARGVVDSEVTANTGSLQDSFNETTAYINAHKGVLIETVEVIKEVPVEVIKTVEVIKEVEVIKIVTETEYVEVPVEVLVPFPVPGPVQTIVQEPPHILTLTLNGTLPDHSTKDYLGVEMSFGSGNTINKWTTVLDETSGELFGFQVHERQGPTVNGVAGTPGTDIDVRWTMPAGAQPGNPDRSLASVDILLDFGVGKPNAGEFIFAFDIDPTLATNYINYKLTPVGANWAMMNPAGTAGQGMTIGNDGHTLSDSFNPGFAFTGVPNGPLAGTGDVLPGVYDMKLQSIDTLTGLVVADLHAQLVLF